MARRSTVARLTLAELEAEIHRRSRLTPALLRRREKAAAELAKIDQSIAELGGTVPGVKARAGRRRAKNDVSLVTALRAALKGRTLGIAEVAEAVQKAGYTSTSPNFRTIITIALSQKKKFFRRVARGQYTAK